MLIIVDNDENDIGYADKEYVHKNGLLHKAFSIFIYELRSGKVLLQKRAKEKYHSGGLWSNSCCSHKYKNETWFNSIMRCLNDELGISIVKNIGLVQVGTFHYYSDYGEMKENEIDHVILLFADKQITDSIIPNPNEIEELRWMTLSEIEEDFSTNKNCYTSWFSQAFGYIKNSLFYE